MRVLSQNHFAGILPSHTPKKRYADMDTLQKDLDEWLDDYNDEESIRARFVLVENRRNVTP